MDSVSDKKLQALFEKHKVVVPIGPSGWKDAGNTLLAKKELAAAAKCYTKGIEEGTTDAKLLCILLSNRSQAYLGLNEFVLALMDAQVALESDPTHLKSFFRKGKALYELERYDEAADAFRSAGGQEKMVASCEERHREQREGVYDWNALLQNTAKNAEHEHDVANFFHPSVAVQEVPGKGLGWVATSDLPAGTLIAVEKATVVVHPTLVFSKHKSPGELAVASLIATVNSNKRVRHAVLELTVGELTAGEEAFLKDKEGYMKELIVQNGFSWVDSMKVNASQRPQDHGYGLWTRCARINHACLSTALYGFMGNLLIVRLANDVVAGEEITISYLSAHDALPEREAKLSRRGIRCKCVLCERQRTTEDDEFNSARATVFSNYNDNKVIHTALYWHGMVQRAETIDDFHVSSLVARFVGGLSADRCNDFARSVVQWEEAYKLQTSEPLLRCMWVEEVNCCVLGIFAAAMTGNIPLAESWTPRLDGALGKFFDASVVQGVGNYMMVSYRMSKQAEAQAKQGPGIGQMMG